MSNSDSLYVFKMPDLGEGTVEAEISEWFVRVGDQVNEGDALADVMTNKANLAVESPKTGKVVKCVGEPGDNIAVGSEFVVIQLEAADSSNEVEDAPKPEAANSTETPQQGVSERVARAKVKASPSVRRRARDEDVDLTQLHASGSHGQITHTDMDKHLDGSNGTTSKPAGSSAAQSDSASDWLDVPVIGVRRAIAQRMQAAINSIAHITYVEEVDLTDLERYRRSLNEEYQGQREKLTLIPFLIKALKIAFADFPQFNAHYDDSLDRLRQYHSMNVGVAAQTPSGLLVPVMHQVDRLSLWEMASQLSELAARAKQGKASPSELSGSSFTISSLGKLGGVMSTPIINAPEVAILGVNKALERPVVVDGAVAVRTMMNLSCSVDHRVIDGYDVALFVQRLKSLLENPAVLLADS